MRFWISPLGGKVPDAWSFGPRKALLLAGAVSLTAVAMAAQAGALNPVTTTLLWALLLAVVVPLRVLSERQQFRYAGLRLQDGPFIQTYGILSGLVCAAVSGRWLGNSWEAAMAGNPLQSLALPLAVCCACLVALVLIAVAIVLPARLASWRLSGRVSCAAATETVLLAGLALLALGMLQVPDWIASLNAQAASTPPPEPGFSVADALGLRSGNGLLPLAPVSLAGIASFALVRAFATPTWTVSVDFHSLRPPRHISARVADAGQGLWLVFGASPTFEVQRTIRAIARQWYLHRTITLVSPETPALAGDHAALARKAGKLVYLFPSRPLNFPLWRKAVPPEGLWPCLRCRELYPLPELIPEAVRQLREPTDNVVLATANGKDLDHWRGLLPKEHTRVLWLGGEVETPPQEVAGYRVVTPDASHAMLWFHAPGSETPEITPTKVAQTPLPPTESLSESPPSPMAPERDGQVLILRHAASVNSVAFSADGRWAVTASADFTARIWDVATGMPVGNAMIHDAPVNHAVFDAQGRLVATASQDGSARLWLAASGDAASPPLRHGDAVHMVAFSPEGTQLVSAGADKVARLWKTDGTFSLIATLRHRDWVWHAAFSPDGRTLATASDDKTARLWDAGSGEPIGEPLEHDDWVIRTRFSQGGHLVATTSADKTVRLWLALSGRPFGSPLAHEDWVLDVDFSPDGKRVVTGCKDTTARIWQTANGAPVGAPLKHDDTVYTASFSPDGRTIATASRDGTARLWNADSGAPLGQPMRHPRAVSQLKFSPDGETLLTACVDGCARIWPLATYLALDMTQPLTKAEETSASAAGDDLPPVIYISYPSTYRPYARTLADRLEKQAEILWDTAGLSSQKFVPSARSLWERSTAVVALIGSQTVTASRQMSEIRDIQAAGKKVVPVFIDRFQEPAEMLSLICANFSGGIFYFAEQHGESLERTWRITCDNILRAIGVSPMELSVPSADETERVNHLPAKEYASIGQPSGRLRELTIRIEGTDDQIVFEEGETSRTSFTARVRPELVTPLVQTLRSATSFDRGACAALAAQLIPPALDMSSAPDEPPPHYRLWLDRKSVRFPWEFLLAMPEEGSSLRPAGIIRTLSGPSAPLGQATRRALLIGNPSTEGSGSLLGYHSDIFVSPQFASHQISHAAAALSVAGFSVTRSLDETADEIMAKLLRDSYEIVMIAGSATDSLLLDDGRTVTGFLLSQGKFLTAEAFANMYSPPRLLFLSPGDAGLAITTTPSPNSDDFALTFLDAGVANLIVPNGPIADIEATRFSAVFFDAMASGASLAEAMTTSNEALFRAHSADSSWGRFCAYGDPAFRLATPR